MHFLLFYFNSSCKRLSYREATHMCVGCVCVNLLKLLSKCFSKLHLLSMQADINRYIHCKIFNILQQHCQNAGASIHVLPTRASCNVGAAGLGEAEALAKGGSIL